MIKEAEIQSVKVRSECKESSQQETGMLRQSTDNQLIWHAAQCSCEVLYSLQTASYLLFSTHFH